jgi:hypothetical protein
MKNPRNIRKVAREQIKSVRFEVLKSGWLWASDRYRDPMIKAIANLYVAALNKAEKGIDPGPERYDDSPFWRVDSKYAGNTVIVNRAPRSIKRFGIKEACLPGGVVIKVKTEHLLSYNKWGKMIPESCREPMLALNALQLWRP